MNRVADDQFSENTTRISISPEVIVLILNRFWYLANSKMHVHYITVFTVCTYLLFYTVNFEFMVYCGHFFFSFFHL